MKNIKKIIESHIPPKAVLLSCKFNEHSSFLRVIIDSSEDISVNDTALLAKEINNDEYIVCNFPEGLRLEVGTPGIGSELERTFQYKKNIGRHIELVYHRRGEIIKKTYLLASVGKNGIVVEKNNKKNDILFDDINSAKIKVSFD